MLLTGVTCVIPTRYESSRLPGKPLLDLFGKPMIVRTWERVCRDLPADNVIIATDDERIATVCREHGIERIEMTSIECRTGTDRVAEVASRHPDVNVWMNVQGDEPLLPSGVIERVAGGLINGVAAANGMAEITRQEEIADETIPKVVCNSQGNALYLSRQPIPHHRDWGNYHQRYRKQVCVYAFWPEALKRFAKLEPGPLEQHESIEILRLIEHGLSVRMIEVDGSGISIDVAADVVAYKARVGGDGGKK